MTTVKRRKAPSKPPLDIAKIVETFTEQRAAKALEAVSKKRSEQLRDELMPLVEQYGKAHGEQGQHLAIELPEPVDGQKYLVRRRNVSRFIDVDAAEELASEAGFLDDIQTTTVTFTFSGTAEEAAAVAARLEKAKCAPAVEARFDQDKLMAFHQQHRDLLPEDVLDELFVEDVTYSFNPSK